MIVKDSPVVYGTESFTIMEPPSAAPDIS